MTENRKSYTFKAYGHPNIRATHVKTIEFTKENELTERGDCIIGVNANFDKRELKKFNKKIKIICSVVDNNTRSKVSSEFKCIVNPEFDSNEELVIRKSHFKSDITFGFRLNRGANNLDRKIVELLKTGVEMKVQIIEGWY